MIEFPLTPFPDVLRQYKVDWQTVKNRYRPEIWRYIYRPEYKIEQVVSYPEWVVACPYKGCNAPVGEPCKGKISLHERRKQAYQTRLRPWRQVVPQWYKDLQVRVEQRRLVVSLEAQAYTQTSINSTLKDLRNEARELAVAEAMISRAVAHGHQRARRFLDKQESYRAAQRVRAEQRTLHRRRLTRKDT